MFNTTQILLPDCYPSGLLYSPARMKIEVRKNLLVFEGFHFHLFYVLIFSGFWKIEAKNFNSEQCFFGLAKLETISPAEHLLSCVSARKDQTIEAAVCGLSMFVQEHVPQC